MRRLLVIACLLLLAGCGGDDDPPRATATPTASAEAEAEHELEGYSQGVRDYYGTPHEHADSEAGNVEAEYHQPPMPAEAGLGETITLTGTNIGVRMEVTVTDVERVGDNVAVHLHMENTGITVYESPLENAAVTYGDGEPQGVDLDASAECSNNFDEVLRIDTARQRDGCLLFPASGDELPDRFQLALESVPTEAGGIWNL
jgi:hypothetical protein